MEMEEIVKILIFVVALTVAIFGVVLLLQGKGGSIIEAIKEFMRFGR